MSNRLIAFLSAGVIILGACAPAAPTGTTPGGTTAPTGTPAAAGSDTFAFQIDSEVSTLAGAPDDLPTSWIAAFIYSALYGIDPKINVVPSLADGQPDISADGLTWTVKLKQGVKFHDGTTMTADDVKFSYDILKSDNCGQNPDLCSSIQDNVASVTVKDPQTVVFQLKQKYAPFLLTGLGSVLIMPKKAIEDSLARFQQGATAVTADEVKALNDRIDTATGDPGCKAETPPDTCNLATYTSDMEQILGKAGITLPDKAAYTADGKFDPDGYALALKGDLVDLGSTLKASAIDQVAASLKIIDFASHPIGTGPYKFVSWTPGEHVEMAAFPDYYRNGVNGFDNSKIPPKAFAVLIRDTVAGSTALGNDEIQWQPKIESDAWKTLEQNPKVKLGKYADNGYYYIAFNMREGHVYANDKLREAFMMCIKHDEDVAAATDNEGIPVYADVPPFSWAFNPDVPKYTFDPAGAKKLIEGEGYALGSDGIYAKGKQKLSTTLYIRVKRPQRLAFATLAKDDLKQCGINIDINEADLTTVLVPKVLDYPNEFDTYLGGWSTSLDPDDYSIFHSSQITTKENPEANDFPGWVSAAGDKLLADQRQELDQAKRKDLLFQWQVLVHNEGPYMFLWADTARTGFSARVKSQVGDIQYDTVAVNYSDTDAWYVTPK
jgi:ABC-type transport system substrate-binding protein